MAFKNGDLSVVDSPVADDGFKKSGQSPQDEADMAGVGKKQQLNVSTHAAPLKSI
jgi:hypothetical protein